MTGRALLVRPARFAGALWRARGGVTVIEFAFVLAPLLMLVMGSLDLGYQLYLRALTTGALERAARKAAIGNYTRAQVDNIVVSEVRAVLPQGVRNDPDAIKVQPYSYSNFSAVGGGERITGDTEPLGVYNQGDCYEDRNNNGRYDATNGGGDDLGTADDTVYYDVTVTSPRLFPITSIIGWGKMVTVDAKTLIRNQPYGQQQIRIRCS